MVWRTKHPVDDPLTENCKQVNKSSLPNVPDTTTPGYSLHSIQPAPGRAAGAIKLRVADRSSKTCGGVYLGPVVEVGKVSSANVRVC